MKRLITLSLAALMVMGLCTTAFAAPDNGNDVIRPAAPFAATDSPEKVQSLDGTMLFSHKDIDGYADDVLVYAGVGGIYDYDYIQPGMTAYYALMAMNGHVPGADSGSTPCALTGVAALNPSATGHFDGTAGTTACQFPSVPVTVADAVKSLKISTKYLTGSDTIDSMKIVYKKTAGTGGDYGYYLAVKTKEFTGTGYKDFGAEVTLKKTSGTDSSAAKLKYSVDMTYNIRFRFRFDEIDFYVYENAFKTNANSADPTSEETFEFPNTNGVYFEVSMFSQTAIMCAMNLRINQDIIDIYPTANLDFYNGNGAMFNRIGTLTIPAEPGTFIYMRDADGRLAAVDAEYDNGEEAFKVPTRVLGQYVVSDVELDLTLIPVAAPEGEPTPEAPLEPEAPVKENVPTGAVA